MELTRAHALAVKARASAGVDSSKLRGSTATQVQEEGVLLVEKYHQPVAYLSSVAVFHELLDGADKYARLRQELPLALRLMAAAVRAGVPSSDALDALLPTTAESQPLDLIHLAELGIDIVQVRAAVATGAPLATYDR